MMRGVTNALIGTLRSLSRRARPASPAALAMMPVLDSRYSALDEWLADRRADADGWQQQAETQAAMRQASVSALDGDCVCCGRSTRFALRAGDAPGGVDLREGLACATCRLNARQRAAFGALMDAMADTGARLYLTEQASPAYVWARHRYQGAIGSEFAVPPARRPALETWLHRQGIVEALREADVTALPFADAAFDAILSFDVLEHVPDYPRALAEFARCLAPAGVLVLTVPFLEDSAATVVRARHLANGDIEHMLPPEIHGDPMSGGVLCYYHFGWDLLAAVRAAGFSDARWCRRWAPAQGLFGLWTLVARR